MSEAEELNRSKKNKLFATSANIEITIITYAVIAS
jgi:hypothetical protein